MVDETFGFHLLHKCGSRVSTDELLLVFQNAKL
jgi:hypothetical protein